MAPPRFQNDSGKISMSHAEPNVTRREHVGGTQEASQIDFLVELAYKQSHLGEDQFGPLLMQPIYEDAGSMGRESISVGNLSGSDVDGDNPELHVVSLQSWFP